MEVIHFRNTSNQIEENQHEMCLGKCEKNYFQIIPCFTGLRKKCNSIAAWINL